MESFPTKKTTTEKEKNEAFTRNLTKALEMDDSKFENFLEFLEKQDPKNFLGFKQKYEAQIKELEEKANDRDIDQDKTERFFERFGIGFVAFTAVATLLGLFISDPGMVAWAAPATLLGGQALAEAKNSQGKKIERVAKIAKIIEQKIKA